MSEAAIRPPFAPGLIVNRHPQNQYPEIKHIIRRRIECARPSTHARCRDPPRGLCGCGTLDSGPTSGRHLRTNGPSPPLACKQKGIFSQPPLSHTQTLDAGRNRVNVAGSSAMGVRPWSAHLGPGITHRVPAGDGFSYCIACRGIGATGASIELNLSEGGEFFLVQLIGRDPVKEAPSCGARRVGNVTRRDGGFGGVAQVLSDVFKAAPPPEADGVVPLARLSAAGPRLTRAIRRKPASPMLGPRHTLASRFRPMDG